MISSVSANLVSYSPPSAGNKKDPQSSSAASNGDTAALSEDQRQQVEKLAETDRKVRAHEAAHLAAAAGIAIGGASFGYESGPDGKRYAISGDVQIAMSAGKTPEETIARAEQVRRAALAPADPSSQDQTVAAEAAQMAATARTAQATQSLQKSYGSSPAKGSLVDAQA